MNKEQEAREAFINYKEIQQEIELNVVKIGILNLKTVDPIKVKKSVEAKNKLDPLLKYLDKESLIELIEYPELGEEAKKILDKYEN